MGGLRVERQELGGEGNVVAGSGGRHVELGRRWLGLDFEVAGRYRGVLVEERREGLEGFIGSS